MTTTPGPAPGMTVAEAIWRRRSVRSYAPAPLDRATVLRLLEAAVQAPTAVHEEPWTFAVVQDRALLRRLSDEAKALLGREAGGHEQALHGAARARQRRIAELLADPHYDVFHGAAALIAICAKPMGPFVAADCWLAAENLMLMACSLGLGTCTIGFAVPVLNTPGVKAELGIPAEQEAVAPIVVGVPRGETPPVGRRPPEIVAWR